MELEGGEIIEFDVLGTEEDEPAEDENELADYVQNNSGKEDINTQTGKNLCNTPETFTFKGEIKGRDSYGNPYKMRNMVVFFAFLRQKLFPKNVDFEHNNG